jgi:hypothetical protein
LLPLPESGKLDAFCRRTQAPAIITAFFAGLNADFVVFAQHKRRRQNPASF